MSFRLADGDIDRHDFQSLTRPGASVSSPGLRRDCLSPTTGIDACEAALQAAERQHAVLLTETFRVELLAVMRRSAKPAETLRLGFTLYSQALLHGDTSLCVEVLEKATRTDANTDAEVAV